MVAVNVVLPLTISLTRKGAGGSKEQMGVRLLFFSFTYIKQGYTNSMMLI